MRCGLDDPQNKWTFALSTEYSSVLLYTKRESERERESERQWE